jgi:hypothetical protein
LLSDSVAIQSNSSTWTFGTTGELTLPEGSTIGETATTTVITPPGAAAGQSLVIRPTAVGALSASGAIVPGTNLTITLRNESGSVDYTGVTYTITGTTAQQLGIGSLTGTFPAFSPSGSIPQTTNLVLPIPGNSIAATFTLTVGGANPFNTNSITVTDNGVIESSHVHLVAGNPGTTDIYLGDDNQYVKIEKDGGDVVIGTSTNTKHWTFGTDGKLLLPGGNAQIVVESDDGVRIGTGNLNTAPSSHIRIGGADHAFEIFGGPPGYSWKFDANSALKLPNASELRPSTAAYDSALAGWESIRGGYITTTISNNLATALGWPMVNWYPTGTTAQYYIDFLLNARTIQNTAGGTLIITPPMSTSFYTEMRAILISIRDSYDASTKSVSVSSAYGKSWNFGDNGTLTVPGNIVDSTGVSQLANRVEGSWTVATGTNTYSFTVPAQGTYTMWVKGNIPNGIITWNATVSVSNNNVPAIGTQYAWNYTGGGSPILLTAIPTQIKGTAGTISTDNTYVGTTSNRFDFGISNTSGASQTIYYGYTKI